MNGECAPIDLAWLRSATSNDAARTKLVLETFVAETQRDMDKLLQARDRERWQGAAHALKSSASAVGATDLLRLADQAQYLPEAVWESRRAAFDDELGALVASARNHASRLMA